MNRIIIFGAGKIGVTLAHILAREHTAVLADADLEFAHAHFGDLLPAHIEFNKIDINDTTALNKFIESQKPACVVSALPYFCNAKIAELAMKFNLAYFDLTEDVATVQLIDQLAQRGKNAYVPQCGVAPGLINIVASNLIEQFDEVVDAKLRCGALPLTSSNVLGYALTWSIDGLINEYGNSCEALIDHELKEIAPLSDLEHIEIDGAEYEAFSTSGGAGSLVDTYKQKVKNLNYKTIRYPGHCDRMRFLMVGLNLNEHRDWLKNILLGVIPNTTEDVVLVYVSINGMIKNRLTKKTYLHKFYPKRMGGIDYSAIQMVTATSAAVVIDTLLQNQEKYQGRIRQEQFKLEDILQSRFGAYLSE